MMPMDLHLTDFSSSAFRVIKVHLTNVSQFGQPLPSVLPKRVVDTTLLLGFFPKWPPTHGEAFVALCFHLSHEDEKQQPLGMDMGRFHLHLHGRIKDSAVKSLADMYEMRVKSTGITVHVHTDEIDRYISKLTDMSGQLFLLDERGSSYTSIDFADKIRAWSLLPHDTHFAIGPAEGWGGLGQKLSRISLSEMTFPHELTAVLMLEQLYRSQQIIKGTSYHKP